MGHGLSCFVACGIFLDQGVTCIGRQTLNCLTTREVPMGDILKDGRSVVKSDLHGEMQALPGGTLVTGSTVALAVLHYCIGVATSLHTPC